MKSKPTRRSFVRASSACMMAPLVPAIGSPLITSPAMANQPNNRLLAQEASDEVSLKDRIYKTLKIGMVRMEGSLTDKFNAAKEAGFHGIEMDSPGMNVEETLKAISESGLPVDGTVCSTHWNKTHTSPDDSVRAAALADLETAIRDTHAVGGNTALLVVGHGKDGTEEEIWPRAIENIRKALPLCARLGVYIAIENVWNKFLYDHDGDHTQTAEKYVKFVDELDSPWVGMQFDIGNHWKYGSMGDWIRQLGKRVVKLDLKGFSREKSGFCKIGEGDLDWADVRKALVEINYYGWAAAEVGGGSLERLKEVSSNMDKAFNLV
ncbi:MAG: sugar phosphate isomerase/epimerase family protein [Mariniblastus sp.]